MIKLLLGITAVSGNILIVTSVLYNGKMSDGGYTYILGSAVCDCLTGWIELGAFYLQWKDPCFESTEFIVANGLLKCTIFASSLHVVIIALDKLLAVVFPLRYQKYDTIKFKLKFIVIAWCLSIIIAISIGVIRKLNSENCGEGGIAFYYSLIAMCMCYFLCVIFLAVITVKLLQIRQ